MEISRGFDDEAAYRRQRPRRAGDGAAARDRRRRAADARARLQLLGLAARRPRLSVHPGRRPHQYRGFRPAQRAARFLARATRIPTIAFLGRALRAECALDTAIRHIGEVPSRSLLSRLTDHYLQIIANRAPIGFEAEFVSQRGHNTLYRGILMPLSSDGSDDRLHLRGDQLEGDGGQRDRRRARRERSAAR